MTGVVRNSTALRTPPRVGLRLPTIAREGRCSAPMSPLTNKASGAPLSCDQHVRILVVAIDNDVVIVIFKPETRCINGSLIGHRDGASLIFRQTGVSQTLFTLTSDGIDLAKSSLRASNSATLRYACRRISHSSCFIATLAGIQAVNDSAAPACDVDHFCRE